MTNELDKQFFDTFGIEPKCQNTFINPSKCPFIESRECCDCVSFEYPQITDRILLELICILTRWHLDEREPYEIMSINIEQLKNQILSNSLYIAKHAKAKHQVRTLFKEGN